MKSKSLKSMCKPLAIMLLINGLIFKPKEILAVQNLKFKTLTFYESSSRAQTQTVNLPNLQSIQSIMTDTGVVTKSVSGDNVIINVNNGVSSRDQTDVVSGSYTPSNTKSVNENSGGYSGIPPTTIGYNSAGYVGTLNRYNYYSYEAGGSYTPSNSKSVSQTSSGYWDPSIFPSNTSYNSDGYSGTLSKTGVSISSGSIVPADTKTVTDSYSGSGTPPATKSYSSGGYVGTLSGQGVTKVQTGGALLPADSIFYSTTMYTDRYGVQSSQPFPAYLKGYSGSLGFDGTNGDGSDGYTTYYSGTYTRPESDTRTYSYSQSYSGSVTKPSTDTRMYSATYSGTATRPASDTRYSRNMGEYSGNVTKPATDTRTYGTVYFYKYTVTISYIDNTAPTVQLSNPTVSSTYSTVVGFNSIDLIGTVRDTDIDNNCTLYYTVKKSVGIVGHTKRAFSVLKANGIDQNFSYSIPIDASLSDGSYVLDVWTIDEGGKSSNVISRTIIVDTVAPLILVNNSYEVSKDSFILINVATNDATSAVSISGGGSNQSGIGSAKLSNLSVGSKYKKGDYIDFILVATDKVGNKRDESIKIRVVD